MSDDLTFRRYHPTDADTWNAFVRKAANATFLHDRGFMDYHADRFDDASVIVERSGNIIAVLPANRTEGTVYSHGGLTYGGLLVPPRLPAHTIVDVFTGMGDWMRDAGTCRMIYKPAPHIFHAQPSEADIYALTQAGARMVRADLGAAIPLRRRVPFSGGRKDGIRKARKAGLEAKESRNWPEFWDILADVLGARHGAKPTHSLAEIRLLSDRFPDRIRLFGCFASDRMLAGIVMFDCGLCVHAQYIAASTTGRDLGALDFLVNFLLTEVYSERDWFSFGISTTEGGRALNIGLSRQKEMFGGHSVVFGQYQWDLT
jgi:hypothetical protein